MAELPPAARRVQAARAAAGSAAVVVEMPETTHTAEQAAAACGVDVARIVKSLVFRDGPEGPGALVLVSGANRAHEKRLGGALGMALARADADFVRAATGYAIGGVPPLAHATTLAVVIDAALMAHPTVWAAGGTPRCVFEIAPAELQRLTGARLAVAP